jgi:hypothetical protein
LSCITVRSGLKNAADIKRFMVAVINYLEALILWNWDQTRANSGWISIQFVHSPTIMNYFKDFFAYFFTLLEFLFEMKMLRGKCHP